MRKQVDPYFICVLLSFLSLYCSLSSSFTATCKNINKFKCFDNIKAVDVTRTSFSCRSSLGSNIDDVSYVKDNKLIWKPEGYKTWVWRDQNINYVDIGGDDSKPPLLLIHGFGASIYHWRYNIPILAEKYHVYALDLLGFGLSG